jgi:hypothetical protein
MMKHRSWKAQKFKILNCYLQLFRPANGLVTTSPNDTNLFSSREMAEIKGSK